MGEFREKFKLPIREFHKSNGIPEEKIDSIEKFYHLRYKLYKHLVKPFPEVEIVLQKLKERNIKLGISSGVKETYLKEHLGQLLNYFDAITSRDECEEENHHQNQSLIHF